MNHRIEQLAAEAKIMTEESINMKISFNTQLKAFSENFVRLMLEECARTIMHESHVQLDSEFGIIYSRAIVDRFGFTIDQPFLTVTLKD